MKKNPINIKKMKISIKTISIIFILFMIIISGYIYTTKFYVIIRFDDLGSITKNMGAYYNGFKIGKIVSIKPDNDFKHMIARVNLTYKNLQLPQNTTVRVQSFPNGELYLQFVYPQSPSLKAIKRGDVLEGIAKYSIEEFMIGQNISGVTDVVSYHVIKTLNATEIANNEIKMFFQNASKLINENSRKINASVNNTATMTENLAQMAENLNQTSKKINNTLDEQILENTTSNIKDTSDNIAKATKDIDKTVRKIDDTISQVNAVSKNLNSITSGLNETLSKRFAGLRIIFGTPVKQKNCEKSCCN